MFFVMVVCGKMIIQGLFIFYQTKSIFSDEIQEKEMILIISTLNR